MQEILAEIEQLPTHRLYGRVAAVQGLLVEVAGVASALSIGSRCRVMARGDREVLAEVVGFRDDRALTMPFGSLDGIGVGCQAFVAEHDPVLHPADANVHVARLRRVLNQKGVGVVPNGFVTHHDPPPRQAPRVSNNHMIPVVQDHRTAG